MLRVALVTPDGPDRDRLEDRLDAGTMRVVARTARFADVLAAGADVAVVSDDVPLVPEPEGGLPPVLLVSDAHSAALRAAALGAPGWGVSASDADAPAFAAAVSAVARGLVVLPADRAWRLVPPSPPAGDDESPTEPLTARERDVLGLLAQGLLNRDIARELGISAHTVKFHLASLFGKLGASTRTEAVRRGLRRGVIEI